MERVTWSNHQSNEDVPAGATGSIPPALTRALRVCSAQSPAQAARAEASLEVLLQNLRSSRWPEVAWRFSQLTADGFPVEFAFSSADDAVRYTAEVAGPEYPESDRLDLAERALSRLGAGRLTEDIRTLFREIQQCGVLRYGVWIGARHSLAGDRYKIYVEVPGGSDRAAGLVRRLIGAAPVAPGHRTTLQMIGFEIASSTVELYFRCHRLEPWETGLLLRRAGLAGRQAELVDLLEQARPGSNRRHCPGPDVGFSFSISPGGEQDVFSVFYHAGALFGGDGSIRRRVLCLAATRGWRLGSYEILSEPLSLEQHWTTQHTMVTFAVAAARPVSLTVGLRPPDPADAATQRRV